MLTSTPAICLYIAAGIALIVFFIRRGGQKKPPTLGLNVRPADEPKIPPVW